MSRTTRSNVGNGVVAPAAPRKSQRLTYGSECESPSLRDLTLGRFQVDLRKIKFNAKHYSTKLLKISQFLMKNQRWVKYWYSSIYYIVKDRQTTTQIFKQMGDVNLTFRTFWRNTERTRMISSEEELNRALKNQRVSKDRDTHDNNPIATSSYITTTTSSSDVVTSASRRSIALARTKTIASKKGTVADTVKDPKSSNGVVADGGRNVKAPGSGNMGRTAVISTWSNGIISVEGIKMGNRLSDMIGGKGNQKTGQSKLVGGTVVRNEGFEDEQVDGTIVREGLEDEQIYGTVMRNEGSAPKITHKKIDVDKLPVVKVDADGFFACLLDNGSKHLILYLSSDVDVDPALL